MYREVPALHAFHCLCGNLSVTWHIFCSDVLLYAHNYDILKCRMFCPKTKDLHRVQDVRRPSPGKLPESKRAHAEQMRGGQNDIILTS